MHTTHDERIRMQAAIALMRDPEVAAGDTDVNRTVTLIVHHRDDGSEEITVSEDDEGPVPEASEPSDEKLPPLDRVVLAD